MFESSEKGAGWQIFRIIMALVCFAVFIYQIYFIGQYLLSDRTQTGTEISIDNYESLSEGEAVWGKLSEIAAVGSVTDEENYASVTDYFMVKTESGRFLTFKTAYGTKCDSAMTAVLGGEYSEMYFTGSVSRLDEAEKEDMYTSIDLGTNLSELGISNKAQFLGSLLTYKIDASYYDERTDEKVIITSLFGGACMLFFSFLFIKKPLKNIIYSVGVATGRIAPEAPEITDPLANELRELESMKSTGENTVEYYRGYDIDGIDFSKEAEKYPEGYTLPTLEKDIETYKGYEEDGLNPEKEKAGGRDIDKF